MIEDPADENCHIYLNAKNWLKEFEHTKIHENDLNEVLMNFFCVHRMYDVASEFQKEARVKPDMPIDTVKIRYQIQNEIMNNKIEEAIEHINNLDEGVSHHFPFFFFSNLTPHSPSPISLRVVIRCEHFIMSFPSFTYLHLQILKKHKDLVFFLKKQQLLKLILNNNINEAILYSQKELAPYVNEKPSLISEIDDVMMLMAYQDLNSEEAKKLIQKIEKKKNTLKRIDDIILSYYNVDSESTLEYIVKNIFFTQNVLSSKYPCSIPKLKNLKTGYIEYYEKQKRRKKKNSSRKATHKSKSKDKIFDDKTAEDTVKDFEVTKEDDYRSV
ncbi:RanBPM and CLTH-like protein, putative [Plasmodium knowlesi strain H]|uniref:RanBPM and CLTH-like protein, putative n=1 Tax=Plasmodium knowlesi (strain H) TaxID=5851 RepID=A0A1A7VSA8_PLAKH|nr:RanBPM and CLTH-like protein, putative [Plasmodium knowlesi strain H]SBO26352.1 RanBPM and CLTH-like protein, putative [Plasmodium knowlesi strain H]